MHPRVSVCPWSVHVRTAQSHASTPHSRGLRYRLYNAADVARVLLDAGAGAWPMPLRRAGPRQCLCVPAVPASVHVSRMTMYLRVYCHVFMSRFSFVD